MPDEVYEIEYVSKDDNAVAGAKRVVKELDKVTEATKRATQAGDGLVKRFEKLGPSAQLSALSSKRKELEETYVRLQQSQDPRRFTKMRALRGAFDTIDARSSLLSASSGIPSGSSSTIGPGRSGGSFYGMRGGFTAGAAEGGLVGGLVGGIVGGITMGLVHAVGRMVKELVDIPFRARDMTTSAKKEEEAIKKVFEWSEGARENVSMLANMWTAFTSALSKSITEVTGLAIGLVKIVSGLGEMNIGKLIGGGLGGMLAKRGETLVQQAIATAPTWLGGLGGTGESGVIEAESRLAAAMDKRKERDQKKARENRERDESDWKRDWNERMERWRTKQFRDAIEQMQQTAGASRTPSTGLYAVGGEAAVRAYWDEANNLQRRALDELKEINKNTKMPMTERDFEMAGINIG